MILIADGLLIDHLEGKCRGTRRPRVVRAQGDTHQDVGQWFVHLGIGMHEVRRRRRPRMTAGSVQFNSCWYSVSSDCGGIPTR